MTVDNWPRAAIDDKPEIQGVGFRGKSKVLLDNKGRDALGALLAAGLGVNQQYIGHRTVGDVELAAVQHVIVTVKRGCGAHGAQCIRAGTRLCQAQRAYGLATAQAGEVVVFLFFICITVDVAQAKVFMRHPAQCQRLVPARESLQHQPADEHVQPGAALCFRHVNAKVTGLANDLEGIFRPPLIVVHALR